MDIPNYFLAFVFFRLFDIFKPWPACWADSKLHSATGVMLDDVFAGLYALGCMKLVDTYRPDLAWTAYNSVENFILRYLG